MDPITITTGPDTRLGGLDFTISLTPAQAQAISTDAAAMADWFHSALAAMATLRTDAAAMGPTDSSTAINDVDRRLLPRIQGIRDALIRTHAKNGGTVQSLADAMDIARSTAQHRRQAVLTRTLPSTWERWANEGGAHPTE
ncbi:hypothetical protein AB0O03_28725 [Streptomyces diastaticus]|uniref:hypothetical protein n=1 Tax=Streptomyces diastaticus TaxID=1956 RepID=UPI003414F9A2